MNKFIEDYKKIMSDRLTKMDISSESGIPSYHAIDENKSNIKLTSFKSIDPLLYEFMSDTYPDHIIDDVGFFTNKFCVKYRKTLDVNESKIKARVEYWISRGWN